MKGKYQGSIPENYLQRRSRINRRIRIMNKTLLVFNLNVSEFNKAMERCKHDIDKLTENLSNCVISGKATKYHMDGNIKVIDEVDPNSICANFVPILEIRK